MQMTANVPGMPDFYDHRAKPDPKPGLPPGWKNNARPTVVRSTYAETQRIVRDLEQVAMRAENRLRDEPGMRMEGRELAAAIGVTVQRLDFYLSGHPRVQKEWAHTGRKYKEGRFAIKATFYFLA